MTTIRSYLELRRLDTFEDRFEYLKLGGGVGAETFGFDRHINQRFYRSREWKFIRDEVLVRDNGCDLGIEGYEIHDSPLIHHMNPLGPNDIVNNVDWILDPDYLITVTHQTHNAIHYGVDKHMPPVVQSRRPGDTRLW